MALQHVLLHIYGLHHQPLLLANGVSARSFGAVEGLVGGVGEGVAGLAVFGVGRDTQREGHAGEGALALEGVFLDAAPDLLGDLHGLLFGESGKNGLVLVAAEAGGLTPLFFVQLTDDAADLTDDVLAEEVTVGVVYLLEVVYVGHKDA